MRLNSSGSATSESGEGDSLEVIYRVDASGMPYRCDSPTVRRHMVLQVDARPPEIEFRSHVVESIVRPSIRPLDRQALRSDEFLTICSWCNRGRIGDPWAEQEVVAGELHLFDDEVPQLTHGMCPDCLGQIMGAQRR